MLSLPLSVTYTRTHTHTHTHTITHTHTHTCSPFSCRISFNPSLHMPISPSASHSLVYSLPPAASRSCFLSVSLVSALSVFYPPVPCSLCILAHSWNLYVPYLHLSYPYVCFLLSAILRTLCLCQEYLFSGNRPHRGDDRQRLHR